MAHRWVAGGDGGVWRVGPLPSKTKQMQIVQLRYYNEGDTHGAHFRACNRTYHTKHISARGTEYREGIGRMLSESKNDAIWTMDVVNITIEEKTRKTLATGPGNRT